jgi:septal ring factor EnvC (AmiA/AmiB activator)
MNLPTDDLTVWYYDDKNVTGGYVLLETDDPVTVELFQKALTNAGILCRKRGACFRPANNNKQYKTFIRISKATGETPNLEEVRAAIRSIPRTHYDASPQEIRTYVNNLLAQINRLRGERDDLAEKLSAKDQQVESLEQQLAELRAQQRRQAGGTDAEELEKLYQTELSTLVEKLKTAEANLRAVLDERDRLRAENNKLQQELREAQRSLEETKFTRLGRSEEFAQLIGCLLPNLKFIGNSIAFMLTEVRDYTRLLRYLYLLNHHEKVPRKAFRGAAGWMEIDKKISDGQSYDVRIYFRKHNADKYLVLVSEKDEQELDKERLRRHS